MDLNTIKNQGLNNPVNIDTSSISDSIFDKIPKIGNVKTEDSTTDEDDLLEDKTDDLEDDDKIDDKSDLEDDEFKDDDSKKDTDNKKKTTTDSTEIDEDENAILPVFVAKYGEVEGEFSEDLDGVTGYFDKVLEKEKASSILEGQQLLLKTKPELKALNEHLEKGFGLNSFLRKQEMIDWDKIILKEDDKPSEELAERIYRQARLAKGDDEDEIDDAIELAKDKGKIIEKGNSGIKYLKKIQEGEIEQIQLREKQERDDIAKEEKEFLDEAEAVLKSGDINGIKLPADKIKALREYSLIPDKEGKTQRERRIETLTVKEGLLLDYLLMNNFKDLGIKPTTNIDNKTAFQKLKAKNDEKVKIKLGGDTNARPNPKTLFNQPNSN